MSDTVTFTPVPIGLTNAETEARIAIFVTPKLDGPALGSFTNWPDIVKNLKFIVRLAKLAPHTSGAEGVIDLGSVRDYGAAVTPNKFTLDALDNEIYKKIFSNCTVKSFKEEHAPDSKTTFKSYDTKTINDCLKGFSRVFFQIPSQQPAQNHFAILPQQVEPPDPRKAAWELVVMHAPVPPPTAAPSLVPLTLPANSPESAIRNRDKHRVRQSPWDEVDIAKAAQRQVNPVLHRETDRAAAKNNTNRPIPLNPLLAVRTFWQRHQRRATSVQHDLVKDTTDRRYDFHQRWALLGHHPQLFPMLGMRIELAIPIETSGDSAMKLSAYNAISITLHPSTPISALGPDSPWVAYEYPAFWAAPRWNDAIKGGFLNIADGEYHLETEDLDHGAQTHLQYAETIADMHPTYESFLAEIGRFSGSGYPPTRKTAGISLMRQYRDAEFHEALQRSINASNDSASESEKRAWFAEDLVRGYAIDLETQDTKNNNTFQWFPLCARKEKLSMNGRVLFDGVTESSMKPVSIEENTHAEGAAPIKERYISESLAHWDGKYLSVPVPPDNSIRSGNSLSVGEMPFSGFHSQISMPPIQQPKRVVGAKYRMRARVEFLTGDRPAGPVKTGNFTEGNSPVSAPPTIGDPKTPGAPLVLGRFEPLGIPETILTASEGGDTHNQTARRNILLTTRMHHIENTNSAWQLIVPPRVTMRLADMHITKDQIPDMLRGFQRLDLNLPDGSLPNVAAKFASKPRIPFLPDPLANEICINAIDRIAGTTLSEPLRLPLYDKGSDEWPDALVHLLNVVKKDDKDGKAFSLEVSRNRPSTTFVGISRNSHQIDLRLTPGYHITLELTSGFGLDGKEGLEKMELWRREGATTSVDAVLKYGHPLLTPSLRIEVVHAVQQPLVKPRPNLDAFPKSVLTTTRSVAAHSFVRKDGAKQWTSSVTFLIDRKSTGRLQVTAEYQESRSSTPPVPQKLGSHTVGDRDVPSNEQADYQRPDEEDLTLSIDPGDSGFRRLKLRSKGLSRFATQLRLSNDECTAEALSDDIDLLNVKPPAAVELAYMVPAFGWENTPTIDHPGFTSKRKGASVRLYLADEWNTSESGELVGIVLKQTTYLKMLLEQHDKEIKAEIKTKNPGERHAVPMPLPAPLPSNAAAMPSLQKGFDHVSGWGLDPKFPPQTQIDATLSLVGWDLRASSGTNPGIGEPLGACGWDIKLQDFTNEGNVVVVGYKPDFDTSAGMYYTDVVFDRAPRYGTYIRLAVVRYQPLSTSGNEISTVVISDFAKLSVDRTLTISRCKVKVAGNSQHKERTEDGLAVSIWGIPGPGTSGPSGGQNFFEVTLERRHYKRADSLGWEVVHKAFDGSSALPPDYKGPKPLLATNEKLLWYAEVTRESTVDRMLVVREYEQWPDRAGKPSKLLFYADANEL